jgi:HEAT repeat protein
MSAGDYAAMSVVRLTELFVDAAKRTAAGRKLFGLLDDIAASTPPEKAQKIVAVPGSAAEIQALGAALRARKPIPEIRQLFESEDRDVRACAAGQFGSIDPEWADATWKGLFAGVPTQEALALSRRARRAPPRRPALKDMSDEALVARFEDATMREYATQMLDCVDDPRDMATRNRIVGEVWDIMRELKARDALGRLLPLLASANMTVRREAATACLRVDEPNAIAVLEEIAAKGKLDDTVPAQDALDGWRKNGVAVYGI